MVSSTINEIFGQSAIGFSAFAARIEVELSERPVTYKFFPTEEFAQLVIKDFAQEQRIYW